MAKIHGKQLRDGTLNPELLRLSGSSPTVGQILTYAGPNEFYWDSLSASLTGGVATDINGTSIDVRTDGLSIFVDGNNDLTLGDPTTGQIGGDYEFLGNIIIDGDLTVNGTATTINTTELRVEDNLITLNSNLTGSTSATTPFAGIEVLRSALPSVELRWNEVSKWWEISNPEGEDDPLTYAPILTTESIISQDGSVSITPLSGLSADTLDLSVTSLNNALSFGAGIVTLGTGPFDGSSNITIEVDSSYANDTFVTSGVYSNINQEIVFTNNTGGTFDVDLSTLDLNDTFITGGTYNNITEDITFVNNDGDSFTVDLSALDLNDTFTTGVTLSGNTLVFDTNDQLNAYNVDLSTLDLNDTFITGGTYNNITEDITFVNNDGDSFTVDLSALDLNDTFATGITTNNGQIIIDGNNGFASITGGTIIETVTGDSPITASTTDGAVTVGLDYSSLQLAVQTADDKNLTPSVTTGTGADTGIDISNTPANNGYVKVEVNGVGYWVADGDTERTAADFYFSNDGGSTAKAISAIVSNDSLYWNNNSSFDLDGDDRVDLFYEVLQ